MGGELEQTIESKSFDKSKDSIEISSSIRTHVANSELHFHDDKKGLKVAVPIGEWWAIWNKVSTMSIKKAYYLDRKTGIKLIVEPIVDGGEFDVKITLKKTFTLLPIKTSERFDKLAKYIKSTGN